VDDDKWYSSDEEDDNKPNMQGSINKPVSYAFNTVLPYYSCTIIND